MKKKILILVIFIINMLIVDKISATTDFVCNYRGGYTYDQETKTPYLRHAYYQLIHNMDEPDEVDIGMDEFDITFRVSGDKFEIVDIDYIYWESIGRTEEGLPSVSGDNQKGLENILDLGYRVIENVEEYELVGYDPEDEWDTKVMFPPVIINEQDDECPKLNILFTYNLEDVGIVIVETGEQKPLDYKDEIPEGVAFHYVDALTYPYGKVIVITGESTNESFPNYPETGYLKSKTKISPNNCLDFTDEPDCISSNDVACVWNSFTMDGQTYSYCNTDQLKYVQCGDAFDIPYQVPQIISFAVNLLKIATPIILIIVSIITLLKAISASNEDEIKKAQKGLVRKVIAAVMVFFIISIVQFVVMKVADNTEKSKVNEETEADNLSTCLSCFLNNKCEGNTYYKTSVFGKYECTYFKDKNNPNADKTCPQDKIKLTK